MTAPSSPPSRAPAPRLSARVANIEESATLAVDSKAKALKAAGRPVIGFGAGEPDFPTPDYIVEAAAAAAHDPRWHRYTPAAGLPALREAIAAKTLRDSGLEVEAVPGAGDQRRQARHLQRHRVADRPRRRGHHPGALLGDLPRGRLDLRRGARAGRHRREHRLPGHRRAARGGSHPSHQDADLRLAVEPDRRGLPRRADRRHRALGRRARHLGA